MNEDLNPQEAEQIVIGQVLFEPGCIARAAQLLRHDHFFSKSYAVTYAASYDLWREGTPVDIVSVVTELRKRGQLDFAGGPNGLAVSMSKVSQTGHLEHHAMIVRDYHGLRVLREAGKNLAAASTVSADPDELIAAINQSVQDAAGVDIASDVNAGERAYSMMNETERPPTYYLGMDCVDGLVFLRPGNVLTISAHSGVGKTAFVLCAILNNIERLKPWFVSLEMPADELITRALCQLARIDIQDAMEGHLNDAEKERMAKASIDHHPTLSRLDIDDSGWMSIDVFMAKAEHKVKNEGVGIIVLDYAQLMEADRKKYPNDVLQNEAISKGVRATARRLKVPILLVVHLNRHGEAHGSTQYEKDAHIRLKLERQPGAHSMNVEVVKNRNGRVGSVETPCDMRYGLIGKSLAAPVFSPKIISSPDKFTTPIRDSTPF